ncbi:hypothetical protein [Flavobacterium sp. HTF]|uniref:hypothetical protein n=1 Tax=Flavobacterium sp. HTF TaxID=2170732 RepID=UPI000D5FC959|nr:hypothetical protein [Flavobacterium sp. HTF]PWB20586.1 hypothetical protein DCO46_20620 [Flavobacterium sp. HTF]
MKKLYILTICSLLSFSCEQVSKSITETITPTDTIIARKTTNPAVQATEIKPPNVDSIIKTTIESHTTTYTETHIEGKGTDFLIHTEALQKAEDALRKLPQYTGKEIFIYSTLYFYNDGTINVMLQHPENPKYIDAYAYKENKWSAPSPVQLSVRDDIKSRLVSLNKVRFVNAAKVVEIYNKKAQEIEGAKPLTSTYLSIWNNQIRWYPTTINGSRERYSIQYNDDGSLKTFKQD